MSLMQQLSTSSKVETMWTLDAADLLLRFGNQSVLQLTEGWTCQPDTTQSGVLLTPTVSAFGSYQTAPLGQVVDLQRFTSLYRFSPFWTRAGVGCREREVQHETLWLLCQTNADHYVVLVPLLGQQTRSSLQASQDQLSVAMETGDASVPCESAPVLFVAVGTDPYALQSTAAQAVSAHTGVGRLRRDKALPDHLDGLGWCTWDAFYKDVSAEKVIEGLQGFAQAGVSPRWMILDDGWQQWQQQPGGEDRLSSFAPNARFDGDLSQLVKTVKQDFGIAHFFVWHALLGYWGGLSESEFAAYNIRSVARNFGPGVLTHEARWNVHPWGAQQGVPHATHCLAFYNDWHAQLAQQGVDGVKVDAQAMLEAVSAGQGGRVQLTRAVRNALETSVNDHFKGRLINCMSCNSEVAYLSHDSVLMRTSDDFFPLRAQSHGEHLWVNAMSGLWWGEFMLPDWDMFQSAHTHGGFHAAARAISGGPVYVSDGIQQHDVACLQSLVLSDGSIVRADHPGRPSPDVLMTDPTTETVLLKIFNRNRDCGVLGVFHASSCPSELTSSVSLSDVPCLNKEVAYVAWFHQSQTLWPCNPLEPQQMTLTPAAWDLVSFAPIEHGLAVLGLTDKLNCTGTIVSRQWTNHMCEVQMRDGGMLTAWAAQKPTSIFANEQALDFEHDEKTGRLQCLLPHKGPITVRLKW